MVDQSDKATSAIFSANSIYPDARSIFTRLQPLDEIKDDCYIVLDTNVLLLPYSIGDEDLLEQIRKTYRPLSAKKRLIVPGQVAREFAKNRANKIAELYQQIADKQISPLQRGKYPLLNSLKSYQMIVDLEEEIDRKLGEYRQKYEKAIKEILAHIQEWRWNDPVTQLYSEIFDEDTIIDLPIEEETLQSDLEHRLLYNIPPGYKDRGKDDRGIGDLLIWHTILEIGRTKKSSVIFVSRDEKADWQIRSKGNALYPRYELVDEFRRASAGQAFHMVSFAYFLELFGASEKIVQQVQQEESLLQKAETIKKEVEVGKKEIADRLSVMRNRRRQTNMLEIEIFNLKTDLKNLRGEKKRIESELAAAEIQKDRETVPGETTYQINTQAKVEQLQMRLQEIFVTEVRLERDLSIADRALQIALGDLDNQEEQTPANN